MTGEDRRNYRSIVSRRWKEIKEDPARLSAYNDRTRQIKNEAGKLGNDSQREKTVAERSAVKQSKKAPKPPELVDTVLDTEDEQETAVKQPKKAPKPPELLKRNQMIQTMRRRKENLWQKENRDSPKKHQCHQRLLIQTQMIQTMRRKKNAKVSRACSNRSRGCPKGHGWVY